MNEPESAPIPTGTACSPPSDASNAPEVPPPGEPEAVLSAREGARLDKLQQAAESASAHTQKIFVAFLAFAAYLGLIISLTSHEDMLLSNLVVLPLSSLGIPIPELSLPILMFYWIAPAFFVLAHSYLLLQLDLLSRKLHRLDQAIRELPSHADQEDERVRLHSFPFSQLLIGRHSGTLMPLLLWLFVCLTVAVLPVLLLIFGQARFLPYHDAATTMWHRVLILLDVLLVLIFWRSIRHPNDRLSASPRRWLWHQTKATPAALTALAFSWALLTFPGDTDHRSGDPVDRLILTIAPSSLIEHVDPPVLWLTHHLFRTLPFLERNLVVREVNLISNWPTQSQVEQFGSDLAWRNFGTVIDLRGRDLRYANLLGSVLVRTNFSSSDLRNSALLFADLQDAVFEFADLQNAGLYYVNLQGARMSLADLQGTRLSSANLKNATLESANLRGATASNADLQGADLDRTQLQAGILRDADLRGANLASANLQGVDLSRSRLEGADLTWTDLRGANLDAVKLQGAVLRGAHLMALELSCGHVWNGDFDDCVDLQGADLELAMLQGANLSGADLQGANLGGAKLQGARLEGASLRGAVLQGAHMWRVLVDEAKDSGYRWMLADLRWANIEQLYRVHEMIEDAVEDIIDGEVRDRVVDQLVTALRFDARPEVPSFPRSWRSTPRVMFDPYTPLDALGRRLGWRTLLWATEDDYDTDLAELLGNLACGADWTVHVAQGLANRALEASDAHSFEGARLYAKLLAERLLGDDCPPLPGLPDDLRTDLRSLFGR